MVLSEERIGQLVKLGVVEQPAVLDRGDQLRGHYVTIRPGTSSPKFHGVRGNLAPSRALASRALRSSGRPSPEDRLRGKALAGAAP